MGVKFFDAGKKCAHDHYKQEPDVSSDHLHRIADVEQGRGSGDHVDREQAAHDDFFLRFDGVGSFLLDEGDEEAGDGAEKAAEPDVDCGVGELGSGEGRVSVGEVGIVAGWWSGYSASVKKDMLR